MKKLRDFVDHNLFQTVIIVVILVNSILLGLQTSPAIMERFGSIINWIDTFCLVIFVIELVLKLIAYNKDFIKSGWNLFDFIIVVISIFPNMGMFSALRAVRVLRVLRSLRSLRALRMISGTKQLRIIVDSVFASLPGVFWTGVLLLIDFYIFSILGTNLFGAKFPEWFGSIGKSMYTLFQVMTLESWSMGISRPVMAEFSWAWIYFVPFVIISAFIVMNVVVGIVVNTISETTQRLAEEERIQFEKRHAKDSTDQNDDHLDVAKPDQRELLKQELVDLKLKITKIEEIMEKME